jgi:tetratricopeptide (TPR) repeat protein
MSGYKSVNWQFLLSMLLLFFPATLQAQTDSLQLKKALALREKRMFNESLVIFRDLLRRDSTQIVYLVNTSFLMARQGIHMSKPEQRMKVYEQARYLAEKAIRMQPNNAEAHVSLAIALGRQSEEGGPSLKIANAKLIRTEAEKAIALNPNLPEPYHILGKWHQIIAGFNGFEKSMISTFYGPGLEGGTYADAIANYNKAIQLEPNNVNHYYQLALTYLDRNEDGDKLKAKQLLTKVGTFDNLVGDDKIIKEKALKKLEAI